VVLMYGGRLATTFLSLLSISQSVRRLRRINASSFSMLIFLSASLCSTPIAFAESDCLAFPTLPTLSTIGIFSPVFGTLSPDEEIRTLQVKVETNSGIFTGTSDDVWLDVGPREWKIGDDFPDGSTRVLDIAVYDQSFEAPAAKALHVKDIAYIRLEKKGICGLTGASDSLLDLAFPPGGATPANLMPSAASQLETLQSQLSDARRGLALHAMMIEAQQKGINANQDELMQVSTIQAEAEKGTKHLNSLIQQKQKDMANGTIVHLGEVVQEAFDEEVCLRVPILLDPLRVVCHIEHKTRPIKHVTQPWIDAEQFVSDRQKEVDALSVKIISIKKSGKSIAVQGTAEIAALQRLSADQTAVDAINAASSGLKQAESYVNALQDLANKASAGLTVAQPGQWDVHKVTVLVNGKVLRESVADKRLKKGDATYVDSFRTLSPEEYFLYGLRANLNRSSGGMDQYGSGITTAIGKDRNVSGWESRPLSQATLLGTLQHNPSPGTDRFVSLDIEVEQVQASGQTFLLGGDHTAPRYIRIEYVKGTDVRYADWHIGDRFRISGEVFWDTDQNGFYELHPTDPSQVQVVNQTETLTGTPDILAAQKKAGWWSYGTSH
jgi:hypothetical protein